MFPAHQRLFEQTGGKHVDVELPLNGAPATSVRGCFCCCHSASPFHAGKTMHALGATEKLTVLPTAGMRAGCARTRTAVAPVRRITSTELPRKVTRSTTPAPWFLSKPAGP